MAERRMFARIITESDAFLDMPLSTQALYFHFGMTADDDGFINNPKKIQRMIGAEDDDFKLLIAKHFLISFDSGVIVVKHWKINNYIQKDRYKETTYQEEKKNLEIKENKAYTLAYPKCIQNVSKLDAQVRLGKVSLELDKDRLEEVILPPPPLSPVPYQEIKDLYNSICVSFPKVRELSEGRKKTIKARWNTHGDIEYFRELFQKAEASDFLKGANKNNWIADFNWMMNDNNMVKIMEDKYINKEATNGTPKPNPKQQSEESKRFNSRPLD